MPKKKEKKKAVHRRRPIREVSFWSNVLIGFVWIFAVCGFLYGVYYVTHLDSLSIQRIDIEGGKTISHDEVRGKVENIFRGSYLLIVPKRFTYMYPHDSVQVAVESVPRVKDVTIKKQTKNTLSIVFDEYVPYAQWCSDSEDGVCYFIDEHGYAFDESPFTEGGALMRHTVEGESVTRGDSLDYESFKHSERLSTQIEGELGFRIASVLYKENNDIELRINGGGMFLIASGMDEELTFENLQAVLTSEAYEHIAPGNFNYVDVRFENKVFVNEEFIKESATSTGEMATSSESMI